MFSGLRDGTAASLMSFLCCYGACCYSVCAVRIPPSNKVLSEEAAGVPDSLPAGVSRLLSSEVETVPPDATPVGATEVRIDLALTSPRSGDSRLDLVVQHE